MKEAMAKVMVPVSFTGMVEVEVPAAVPQERCEALAHKVALARVLATTENPDAPEDDACEEYQVEFGLDEATAERNWDACRTTGVSGNWSLQAAVDDRADMKRYDLHLDGRLFLAQRELLLRIADLVRRKQPYQPATGDEGLLEGLLNLTDSLADQAHDQYGIDCLLPVRGQ